MVGEKLKMTRLLKNYPLLLLFSAFGPYLSISLGVKFDNIIVYFGGSIFLVLSLKLHRITMHKNLLGILIIWFSLFIYLLARTLIGGGAIDTFAFVAEIKNFSQPLFILCIFVLVLFKNDIDATRDLLKKSGKLLLLLLSLNTLWMILGFFVDLTEINQYFWRGKDSTAMKAAENGRYSGVFNQPIEAGVAYTIGLYIWAYLLDLIKLKITFRYALVLILIIVGGIFTVSKVFIIFGLVIFILYLINIKHYRMQLMKLSIFFLLLGLPIYYYLIKTWSGFSYFQRLFNLSNYRQQGVLNLITAGRYGTSNSQQNRYFDKVWSDSPLLGKGLGSQQIYDSAFFHVFSSGGLIALIMYLGILFILLFSCYQFYFYSYNSPEFKLYLSLFLLTIVGGLGAPVLTINRSSIILWVFIGLVLQFLSICKKEKMRQSFN